MRKPARQEGRYTQVVCIALTDVRASALLPSVLRQYLFHFIDWDRLDRAAVAGDSRRLEQGIDDSFFGRLDHSLKQGRHRIIS